MKNALASKMSYFILTFIFLIIIASFLFSGYQNFSLSGTQHVASVDGTPISIREYQIALNRQVEFFNQMMGGSGMTQKQLEELGIKQSVLNGLIQQKLVLNAADQMGIVVSQKEIKNEIKNLPYFLTNGNFDVNLYRNVLQSNGYTPTQFEDLISNDLKQKKVDELFSTTLVSEGFVKDVMEAKNNKVVVHALKVGRQALAPLISVSEDEVKAYLAKPESKKELEALYNDNFAKYNQSAEVKARHILISGEDDKALEKAKTIKSKVTPKNFAEIANKETQDPSGKNTGGDLGWFGKGRMVPEFENVAFDLKPGQISDPVKTQFGYHVIYLEDKKAAQTQSLESVKNELARMALQKNKATDLDKLLKTEETKLVKALEQGQLSPVEEFDKKVQGQLMKNAEVNQFDQSLGQLTLAPKEVEQIFQASEGAVLNFGNAGTIYLVKILNKKTDGNKIIEEQLKNEVAAQNQALSRRTREQLIKAMNDKAKVVTNPSLL
jgi:peptidyl-prolyl cis-trans isomerase D